MGALPPGASIFLKRAAIMFVTWKLSYILLLQPIGEPDRWLVKSLGESTVSVLNIVHGETRYKVRHVEVPRPGISSVDEVCAQLYRPGMRSDIGIFPGCNGLELMVLAAGFILCFEGRMPRKAAYLFIAVTGIMMVNIVRCCLLTVIKTEHPVYFTFAHKYLFNLSGYGFVFLLWMRYVKGIAVSSETATHETESLTTVFTESPQ
jgi:exosortase/archaeosortase family protein